MLVEMHASLHHAFVFCRRLMSRPALMLIAL
jgi:hypothetical protein